MKYISLLFLLVASCNIATEKTLKSELPSSVLDYKAMVTEPTDRDALVFSDQGAWFGYSLPSNPVDYDGFIGPFLMTQENGRWLSPSLTRLEIINNNGEAFNWSDGVEDSKSYNSHLEKYVENDNLKVGQQLVFRNEEEAVLLTTLTNKGGVEQTYKLRWHGDIFLEGISLEAKPTSITVTSAKSSAIGEIIFDSGITDIQVTGQSYEALIELKLASNETKSIVLLNRFSFRGESSSIPTTKEAKSILEKRIRERNDQFSILKSNLDSTWMGQEYEILLAKTMLTLQNNWRSPAGELKHSGLFPSYHYVWFHGFWAWDSWKHAVALAQFDSELAKEQVRAMYSFIDEEGFIPDCVYRDTTIEAHNYRNTKPPLSGWAIEEIFQSDGDIEFIKEIYPLLVRQHEWWYRFRDNDGDGVCEYGSTDGSLIAAKWDSGMDNAVRFDDSGIVQNGPGAFSLDQESVDLNAYLYAEKLIIAKLASAIGNNADQEKYSNEAKELAEKIRQQFFDPESGWFYDTNLAGTEFIKVMGCEGWIPLWAGVANIEQAIAVRNNIMTDSTFNTKVPLQTLAANHPKFKPDGGYWRGPNWLDQAYFGVRGLRNYGFNDEANQLTYQLFHGAEGVLEKGPSIRENYQPITGGGLESENFSWSAAHYLLLLLNK